MNIFATDPCPIRSATVLANRHVVKMALESAQMLSTALRAAGVTESRLYRAAYQRHPCTLWSRQTRANFLWLCDHADALCAEKLYRYPDKPPHKSQTVIDLARSLASHVPDGDLLPFAQAMPDEHRHQCAHLAYRRYLRAKYDSWSRPPRFGRRLDYLEV
jgi:hypothetical protein